MCNSDLCPTFAEAQDASEHREYPDDFEEEEEEEDLEALVHTARAALHLSPQSQWNDGSDQHEEEFHLSDAGGFVVTLKALRDQCIMGNTNNCFLEQWFSTFS